MATTSSLVLPLAPGCTWSELTVSPEFHSIMANSLRRKGSFSSASQNTPSSTFPRRPSWRGTGAEDDHSGPFAGPAGRRPALEAINQSGHARHRHGIREIARMLGVHPE